MTTTDPAARCIELEAALRDIRDYAVLCGVSGLDGDEVIKIIDKVLPPKGEAT